MSHHFNPLAAVWTLLITAAISFGSTSLIDAQNTKVDFVRTIKPIFEQHCISCHGPTDPDAFRIDLKDEAMDYIVPEAADESQIYEVLTTDDEDVLMPPPDEDNALTPAQIKSVKDWIDQGAQWPANVKLVAPAAAVVAAQADEGAEKPEAADNQAPAPIDPKTQRLFDATGSLHPAAVHLPVGLLLAAGLFALFSLRGNFVMSDCAYYCLWLGTLGAIIACVTGWWCSPLEGKGTVAVLDDLWNQKHPVFWHRTWGLGATIFALVLALFATSARNRDPDDGVMWKLGAILLALAIGWVGHLGGELTHGKHHYDDLKAIGAELLPGVFGEPEPKEEGEDEAGVDEAAKPAVAEPIPAQPTVGQTSDET